MPAGVFGTGAQGSLRASQGVYACRFPGGAGEDYQTSDAGTADPSLPVYRRPARCGNIQTHFRRRGVRLPAEEVAQTTTVPDRELYDHQELDDVPGQAGRG